MNFQALQNFLKDLNRNNSKEWMDKHRKQYTTVRTDVIQWLDRMDTRLASIDKDYYATPGKKGINRINNNLMFHPNKPIYKDHFGAGLDKAPNSADFYVELGIEEGFLAGGFWRPDPKTLRSIREAIDYDGEVLKKIISKKKFRQLFGDLVEDKRLTKAPKGFPNDHQHIELLRNKTFAVVHRFSMEETQQPGFEQKVITVYQEMLPFRRYLNKAVTV